MGKSTYLKISLFLLLLFLSNLYLIKSGYWFAQDTSYWPKNNFEAFTLVIQQLHVFTNFGYYPGFDQGLFNFTRIEVVSFIALLEYLFGFAGSQIVLTLSGYIVTFISFYLFTGIFFKNNNVRYILTLLYTFNPLSYTMQGSVFYNAAIPLFIYSFNKYFYTVKKTRLIYLLLNIFAAFIWVSYIRFLQADIFVIVPYCIYLLHKNGWKLQVKKLLLFFISYILLFAPILYSVLSQLFEKSQTAFYYGNVFGKFVAKEKMVDAFNIFQSIGVHLYEQKIWAIVGIVFFLTLLFFLITYPRKKYSAFLLLNLGLVILSMGLFGLANLVGETGYFNLIRFLPFIINQPFFALFILNLPLVVLIGLLTEDRTKHLYIYAFLFLIAAVMPFLNLSDQQFKKFDIATIPGPYKLYMVDTFDGIPESTYYFLNPCWRAKYMTDADVTTICLNWGLHYVSAVLADPRLVSGDKYQLSQLLTKTTDVDNLRVTHNLKNIILPSDIVDKNERLLVGHAQEIFDANPLLDSQRNENFIHYSYKDKGLYDFLLYSPASVQQTQSLDMINANNLAVQNKPVLLRTALPQNFDTIQSVKISYKLSPINPTKYYLHLEKNNIKDPFIIQLNQDFHSAWKLKLVDKAHFDLKNCETDWEIFPITNNERCQYKSSLIELSDINLLLKPSIDDNNHLQSNFINNAWLVGPTADSDLYAVIINEKQIYYTITLIIFGITLVSLLLIAIMQEILIRKRGHSL